MPGTVQSKGPGGKDTFALRYYVCKDQHRAANDSTPGPIFFYLGNESDVRHLILLGTMHLLQWSKSEYMRASLILI